MKGLEAIVQAMRENGIRRLRFEADGALELELAEDSQALPTHSETDTGPTTTPERTPLEEFDRVLASANGDLCIRCGKVKAAGLVAGHCRPCGRLVLNARA